MTITETSSVENSNYFISNNFLSKSIPLATIFRKSPGNLNLQMLHQVLFLDETWAFANGSNIKMWSDCTSQYTRKARSATITKYITMHITY
jgi:hypothetical protein